MAHAHGTEIAFRLGPGTLDEARAIADRLGAAAAGARRHILFAADEGAYGCLAEFASRAEAEAYARAPAVAAERDALAERTGKRPQVRLYAMEERPG